VLNTKFFFTRFHGTVPPVGRFSAPDYRPVYLH
jgi:hypothetical protein